MNKVTKIKLNKRTKELYNNTIGTLSFRDQLTTLGFKQRYGRKYKKFTR